MYTPDISGIFKYFPQQYKEANNGGGDACDVYDPLWRTMWEKGVTTYTLIEKHHFSRGTLDSLQQGRNITTSTRNGLCRLPDCRVEDVLVYIPDE